MLTLNVQGLRTLAHRQTLMEWLNCFGPDFVCLQETHSISEDEFLSWFTNNINIHNRFRYRSISSPGSVRSCGVAILYKTHFHLENCFRDTSGRLVVGTFKRQDSVFQIASLYGPNKKPAGQIFFESLFPALDPDIPLFLGGDFNTVVNANIDRLGCNPSSAWAYNWSATLKNLMDTFDLKDCWREKHPSAVEFTWKRANGQQASRIDMFWISDSLLRHVNTIDILPFFRSDHSYVFMEINILPQVSRGPGVWKFNTAHLSNEAFRSIVVNFWSSWRDQKERFSRLSNWWDAGKTRLKSLIKKFSRSKAKDRRKSIKSLNATIFHIQRRIENGEPLLDMLNDVKAELELELLTEASRAQLRARIQWAEEGESSTSFFLQQEKTRGKQRIIDQIKHPDGSVVTDIKDIIAIWANYYSSLYKAQELDVTLQDSFLCKLERHLTSEQAQYCEGLLTVEECFNALKAMPSNKTPGLDGLPAEFFLSFWELLGNDLVEVLNSCFELQSLSKSQRSGLITLLFKKDDPLLVTNWRPITLLCVDYKIMSKALANRLLVVIHLLISPDQTCGVPGRFMGENIRLIHDIIEYANDNDLPGAILSLDQEKAFDRVDWCYMQRVLFSMGFGESFRSWVQLLYNNANSAVLVNGFVSEAFPVSRGVRQGCPLSPLLYVLVAETLACAIRKDNNIDGFPIPLSAVHPKLSQYADDTSGFVSSDRSICAIFDLFSRYEEASGAKLNRSKCKALLIGSWKDRVSLPCDIKCTSQHIVTLGTRLSNEGSQDWETLIKKLEYLLLTWKRRSLSLRGRALVVKSLGLSIFWFLSTVSIMPDNILKRINSLIFPFIWGKSREAIKRDTLCNIPSQGGLGVTNICDKLFSLLCLWPKRFLFGEHRWWKNFFEYYIRVAFDLQPTDSINDVLLCPSFDLKLLKKMPVFYATVLIAWAAIGNKSMLPEWNFIHPTGSIVQIKKLSASVANKVLRSRKSQTPRCVNKYKQLGLEPVDWKQVWRDQLL